MADTDTPTIQNIGGNSPEVINGVSIGILVALTVATVLGVVADRRRSNREAKEVTNVLQKYWVIAMLATSYTLVIPYWFAPLFAYKIGAINGMIILMEMEDHAMGFAVDLSKSGAHLGAFFIIMFTVVVPITKIVLLVLGSFHRYSDNESQRRWSRRFVIFVQQISKWATPDLLAYILLMYLIRGLNKPVEIVSHMRLDLGFTCGGLFSIASTISSLGMEFPKAEGLALPPQERRPLIRRTFAVLLCVVAAFSAFFFFGMEKSVMSLRLDLPQLFASGMVDPSFEPVIKMLGIENKVANDVNLSNCISALWGWVTPSEDKPYWEFNSVLGLVLLGGLVVVATLLDMFVMLVLTGYMLIRNVRPRFLLEAVRYIGSTSMLDVTVMGVIIVVATAAKYKEAGLILKMESGLLFLFLAEACHYTAFALVTRTAERVPCDDTDIDCKGLEYNVEEPSQT